MLVWSAAVTTGGRTWWAHFDFPRMNIAPAILRKRMEDDLDLRAFLAVHRSREAAEVGPTLNSGRAFDAQSPDSLMRQVHAESIDMSHRRDATPIAETLHRIDLVWEPQREAPASQPPEGSPTQAIAS